MDDKELELYPIFQAIDVEHNGCILLEELYDALLRAGIEIDDEELARFVERSRLFNPEGISMHIRASRDLIAGVAGAASCTATALLDRLKVVPESAIRFYTNKMLKNAIVHVKSEEDKVDIGVAGAVAQTAIYPMDLVKTRLQTCALEAGKVLNLVTRSKEILVREGPRTFYRGLIPSLLGIIPYAGIDLAVYETLNDMSRKYILDDGEPGPLMQLGCGSISGALGAT
ncbi:hypothetical protein U1Q18_038120 [Sarracenia purpurea var. burkii]